MPTYTYKCKNDHEYVEVRGMLEDQKQTVCPQPDCGEPLRRIYDTNPIQFKGQGWAGKGSHF